MSRILRRFPAAGLLLVGACASTPPEPPEARLSAREGEIAWETCGRSTLGRPLRAATFGNGPRHVYLIGGIHGDEPEGGLCLPEALQWLREPDACEGWTVRVLEDLNPDGTARGTRSSATGVDLNRNWPASNFRPARRHGQAPASEPEVSAVVRDLETFRPDLVLVFHSARGGPFVNWDGPGTEVAARFSRGARQVDGRWTTRASIGYPTPGSLGTWIGVDQEIPILTVEFRRGADEETARRAGLLGLQALLGEGADAGR